MMYKFYGVVSLLAVASILSSLMSNTLTGTKLFVFGVIVLLLLSTVFTKIYRFLPELVNGIDLVPNEVVKSPLQTKASGREI